MQTPKRNRVSNPTSKGGVSRVQQNGARESSPQFMIDQMNKKRVPLPEGKRQPIWSDFTSPAFLDFHHFMNETRLVEQTFIEKVPSRVREYFKNDPSLFAQALDNPKFQETFAKLGFKVAPPPKEPATPPTPRPDPEANPFKQDATT